MPQSLRPDDPRLTWQGAVSLETAAEWVAPWRIPHGERDLYPGVRDRAQMAAGVRIAFRTDSAVVAGRIEPREPLAPIDLCCDGKHVGSQDMSGKEGFRFDGLPTGTKLVELWLPHHGSEFRLKSLRLSDGASLGPFEDARPRWVAYGSSITHAARAQSPAYTWPAVVARGCDLNLTCLGYGGQCHLDPMIARMIRDLPADVLSMKVGINIMGGGTLNPRSFRPAIIGTVRTIREGHPDTPFAVVSPIYNRPREETPNAVGFTLRMMREEVAEAVEALRAHGDAKLHYFDGMDLIGPNEAHLMPDELHPGAEGNKAMGRRFIEVVMKRILPRPPS